MRRRPRRYRSLRIPSPVIVTGVGGEACQRRRRPVPWRLRARGRRARPRRIEPPVKCLRRDSAVAKPDVLGVAADGRDRAAEIVTLPPSPPSLPPPMPAPYCRRWPHRAAVDAHRAADAFSPPPNRAALSPVAVTVPPEIVIVPWCRRCCRRCPRRRCRP